MSCKSDLKIDINNEQRNNKIIENGFSNISPRAIPIILLLSKCLGQRCIFQEQEHSTICSMQA